MEEIIKECDNCKYVMTDTESFPCNRCTRNAVDKWEPIPKQTNAMRIRSMTDEELAKIIVTNPIFTWDKVEEDYEDVLNWLQSEAE